MTPSRSAGTQTRERFVEQQHRGLRGQRQAEFEPAFFAIGQGVDDEVGAIGKPELFDQSGDYGFDLGKARGGAEHVEAEPAALPRERAEPQILPHRQLRKQLVDLIALGQAVLVGAGYVGRRDVDAVQQDAPGIDRLFALEEPQEGALAGAVGADNRVQCSFRERQRDRVDRLDAAIGLADVAGFKGEFRGGARCGARRQRREQSLARRSVDAARTGWRSAQMEEPEQLEPTERADDAVGQEGHQENEHRAENELPKAADGRHLLQGVAQHEPDRRADGRADQRAGAAHDGLDYKLSRGIQVESVGRHVALKNAEQRAGAAGEDSGEHEHRELIGAHVVAERCGALRILPDCGEHRADRGQHDETRQHEAGEKESGDKLIARPGAGETVSEAVERGCSAPARPANRSRRR